MPPPSGAGSTRCSKASAIRTDRLAEPHPLQDRVEPRLSAKGIVDRMNFHVPHGHFALLASFFEPVQRAAVLVEPEVRDGEAGGGHIFGGGPGGEPRQHPARSGRVSAEPRY